MNNKIDLHLHSLYSSDGNILPEELVKLAKEVNLKAIALTDHNTMEGIPEFIDAGKKYGIETVPGIEIDTIETGKKIHILGYYLDYQSQQIKKLAEDIKDKLYQQAKKRVNLLKEMGFIIEFEEALKIASDIPVGGVLAETIIINEKNHKHPDLQPYIKGGNKSDQPYFNFFLDFFTEGKKAFIALENYNSLEVIRLIKKIGGVPVLAHPGYNLDVKGDRNIILEMVNEGLLGIEAYSSYHNQKQMEDFAELGRELDLIITAGSDFHGKFKPKIKIGQIQHNDYDILVKLKNITSNFKYPTSSIDKDY